MHPDIDAVDGVSDGGATPLAPGAGLGRVYDLPPPELREAGQDGTPVPSDGVRFLGTSTLFLPPLRLPAPAPLHGGSHSSTGHNRIASDATDSSIESDASDVPLAMLDRLKVCASQTFELTYLPTVSGILRVGGIRVLLIEDRLVEEEDGDSTVLAPLPAEPRILKEWEVVAEVWVKS